MKCQSQIPVILALYIHLLFLGVIVYDTLLFSEKTESAKIPLICRFYDDKMERHVRSTNATKRESLIFLSQSVMDLSERFFWITMSMINDSINKNHLSRIQDIIVSYKSNDILLRVSYSI